MQYTRKNNNMSLMIILIFVLLNQAIATPDALPSSCKNFSLSMIEKTYIPSDIININASCCKVCPSWDIITTYPDDVQVLLNDTIEEPDGRCVRNMSILAGPFKSLKKRVQLAVKFRNPTSEPVRTINVEKSTDGETCRQDWDCYDTNQSCTNGTCACPSKYSFSNNRGTCYPVVLRYFGECQVTEQCRATKSICKNSACQCPDHFFPDEYFFNCLPEGRSLGESCATDDNCHQRDINAWCTYEQCACKPNYIESDGVCHVSDHHPSAGSSRFASAWTGVLLTAFCIMFTY